MGLAPLFPFYGSKWSDARRYPPPEHGRVIEPFAWRRAATTASGRSTTTRSAHWAKDLPGDMVVCGAGRSYVAAV